MELHLIFLPGVSEGARRTKLFKREKKNLFSLSGVDKFMVPSRGIEPLSEIPQIPVLSIKLRGQLIY